MSETVSRRSFLLAGAGLTVAAACGRGERAATTIAPTTTTSAALNLLLGIYQPLAGAEQRVSFGVIRGQRPIGASEPVSIAFGKVGAPLSSPQTAARRADGIEDRPLHVVRFAFPEPGNYRAVATVGGEHAEAAFAVIDPATSKVPVAGSALRPTPTPTVADHRGVEPICTRQPACPWHDVSLDTALAERRPIALLFSTPALCQSAVCGPVLDILLGLRAEYEGRVRFVHAEIYTDNTGQTTTPAVQAYSLENEPFLFLAGADGKVRERFDGPYDRSEAADALRRLVAT